MNLETVRDKIKRQITKREEKCRENIAKLEGQIKFEEEIIKVLQDLEDDINEIKGAE